MIDRVCNVMNHMSRMIISALILFLSGCAAVRPVVETEQTSLQYVQGTVQKVSGNEIVLSLKLPEFKKTSELPINEIARQIIQKSLFFEGLKTEVNGIPAVIKEVRGNIITAVLEKAQFFSVGTTLRLQIPKKTIAVTDFEVIRGREKEAGRVTLEGLTSALIDSGHFTVVERTKLKTIMDELQLSLSGLTKETPEKVLGKLFMADLILTGTLAEISGVWEINLRLVNVRTGQATAAISMTTPLFKPTELRDASAFNEDFETDAVNSSWAIGQRAKGVFFVKPDAAQGAENTKQSLRMDFNFQKGLSEEIFARMENMKKRDLSLFSGIEFYAKSDMEITGQFRLLISDRENPNMIDAWIAGFPIGTDWKIIKISFEQLSIGRGWIKEGASKFGAKPGKQILDLSRVESVSIGAHKQHNPTVKGTMWIDKVRFYRE